MEANISEAFQIHSEYLSYDYICQLLLHSPFSKHRKINRFLSKYYPINLTNTETTWYRNDYELLNQTFLAFPHKNNVYDISSWLLCSFWNALQPQPYRCVLEYTWQCALHRVIMTMVMAKRRHLLPKLCIQGESANQTRTRGNFNDSNW